MTPVKSFIWGKDAAGIRGECIEMRNRVGEGCWGRDLRRLRRWSRMGCGISKLRRPRNSMGGRKLSSKVTFALPTHLVIQLAQTWINFAYNQ